MTAARKHLHNASRPAERHAALFLAVAQRDLAIARASSPEILAEEEPQTADPAAEYWAWVARMEESERHHRAAALRCIVTCRRDDDGPNPARPLLDPESGPEFADSVRRARGAIAAMTGPDPAAAQAARYDVLVRWHADDEADGWRSPC